MSFTVAPGCEQRTTSDGYGMQFYDVGTGQSPVLLLHGLFGSPSNWQRIMQDLSDFYRFFALQFPIDFGEGRTHVAFKSLSQLTDHVARFFDEMNLDRAVLCGNSLGGQVALDFHARYPERVDKLVLCGSAGLFERNLGGGRPPRLCRQYIRNQACEIFHDPVHVDDALVDAVYAMLGDRQYRRFLLRVAKASRDRCMLKDLANVRVPTMVIWGKNDSITPPFVAEEFCDKIPNAELVFIDDCGHSPPIEQPDQFARLLHAFLSDVPLDHSCVPCKPR